MRHFIQLSYKGTNYHGWQIQPDQISIQEELEKAFQIAFQEKIEIVGCGRTDTGVHAKNYWAHFDSHGLPLSKNQLVFKLNNLLPKDIVIHQIKQVSDEAHARFDASFRRYIYQITDTKNPFELEFAHYVIKELDVKRMNEACKVLYTYENFKSFSKVKTQVYTYNCKIMNAEWKKKQNGLLVFEIKANRFLRNMVRAIVGTMIDIGLGKISVEDFKRIIESKNRSNAGTSVPAKGLFLVEIGYPNKTLDL